MYQVTELLRPALLQGSGGHGCDHRTCRALYPIELPRPRARAGLEPATSRSEVTDDLRPTRTIHCSLVPHCVGVQAVCVPRLSPDRQWTAAEAPPGFEPGYAALQAAASTSRPRGQTPKPRQCRTDPGDGAPGRSVTVRQQTASCARVGTYGWKRSCMRASRGVRSALRRLHDSQAATVFIHDHRPPRLAGSTWSIVVALRPQ